MDLILCGSADLAVPQLVRRQQAEKLSLTLAKICAFDRSQFANTTTWASDGSMLPSSAGVLDPKTVVGAATDAQTLAMKVLGTNISILHGELIGLILALILSSDTGSANGSEHLLLTDHLNTIRLIEDAQTGVNQTMQLCFMNGRSYYRWLLALTNHPDLLKRNKYTQGHSNKDTIEAKLNDEADFYVSSLQKFRKTSHKLQFLLSI
jgi:hypothetical protein